MYIYQFANWTDFACYDVSNKYIAKAIISPTNKCLTKEQDQRQQTDLETIENLGSASRTHDFSKTLITS